MKTNLCALALEIFIIGMTFLESTARGATLRFFEN